MHYFIKETKASTGYNKDPRIIRFDVTDKPGTENVQCKISYSLDNGSTWTYTLGSETTYREYASGATVSNRGATSSEPPKYFKISLTKIFADTILADASDAYSLKNAAYTFYYGASWATAEELTDGTDTVIYKTDENGAFTTDDLPLLPAGTDYFFKETKASKGCDLDKTVYCVHAYDNGEDGKIHYKVTADRNGDGVFEKTVIRDTVADSGKAIEVISEEPLKYFLLSLTKESENKKLTDDNDCYSFEGAEYTLYTGETWRDASVFTIDGADAVYTTDANGHLLTGDLPIQKRGTYYYLKETKASPGYELDQTVFKFYAVTPSTTADRKIVYQVYSGEDTGGTAEPDFAEIAGKSGMTDCGFAISFNSLEPPASDPFRLTLHKGDAETGEMVERGEVLKFNGAIFELSYYDNTDGTASGAATRKWYFETDEAGVLDCNKESYLKDYYELEDGTELISDYLYRDNENNVIYPVGTYVIKEIIAPPSFTLVGNMHLAGSDSFETVTDGLKFTLKRSDEYNEENDKYGVLVYQGDVVADNEIEATNLSTDVYDTPHRDGTGIKVVKKGDNDKLLEGVEYKLVGDNGDTYTATTDAKGEVVFENLLPQYYTLTETKTVNGTTLMKDNIRIRLPYSVTPEEAEAKRIDTSEAEFDEATGTWCFYKLTYTVTNHGVFDVPFTGMNASAKIWMPLVCGLAVLAFATFVVFKRKRTK